MPPLCHATVSESNAPQHAAALASHASSQAAPEPCSAMASATPTSAFASWKIASCTLGPIALLLPSLRRFEWGGSGMSVR